MASIDWCKITSLRSRRIRLGVAVFLIVPFLLREIHPSYEMYPAVLMPSGAHKVDLTSHTANLNRCDVFAVLSNGDEQRLNPRQFLDPIPVHYLRSITVRRFGWGPHMQRTKSVGQWRLSVTTQRAASEAEKRETRLWLSSQLERMGIRDAVAIRARLQNVTFDIAKQVELNRRVQWEYDVALVD